MSEVIKKKWVMRDGNGKKVSFNPVWDMKMDKESVLNRVNITDKEIECVAVEVGVEDRKGKELNFSINFQNLFMFVYYVANEELRKQLALRYERQVNYLPYEVTFKLDESEKKAGFAKRRVELPVDEISMAIARNEAMKIKNPFKTNKLGRK